MPDRWSAELYCKGEMTVAEINRLKASVYLHALQLVSAEEMDQPIGGSRGK